MNYETPEISAEEEAAIQRIEEQWTALRWYVLDTPSRWLGSVRRVLSAVANQGSNSIEGYNISTEDAIAAVQGATEPMESDLVDWQANLSYRRAMTYVLQLAKDEDFEYTSGLIRSLHYMMMEYSLEASPGLWRPGAVWIRNDQTGEIVYEAPDADSAPYFVNELMSGLNHVSYAHDVPPIVTAAMAHLNLVLIHPFRDGNGRMARTLQSLVLVREGVLAREFCSIEEYLGQQRNQQTYYDMLARVAGGHWSPENDAQPWVRYCLRAHYIQALSVLRRVRETERMWGELEDLAIERGLPLRSTEALYTASLGLKVRNASYRQAAESWGGDVSSQTASNDLRAMVEAGLVEQHGAKRGTFYMGTPELRRIYERAKEPRQPLNADDLFKVEA